MVGGPDGNPVEGEVPPPRLRQPRSGALEAAKRRGAERHEDPRSDGLDLAPEVRPTRFQFVRLRRPVRGGSTLDHIRDEDVLPRDSGGGEGPIEHLAGGPHKRSAGRILLPSRRFADQEQVGVDRAFPCDRPGPVPVQPTQGAFPDLGGDLLEDDRAFTRRAHAAGWPGAFIAFADHSLYSDTRFVRALIFGWTRSIFPSSFARTRSNFRSAFSRSTVFSFIACWARRISARYPASILRSRFSFRSSLSAAGISEPPRRLTRTGGPQMKDRFRAITTSRTPLVYVYFSVWRSASIGKSTTLK